MTILTRETGSLMTNHWTATQAEEIFALPLPELIFRAQSAHRAHFAPDTVQVSTLLSIKTGSCPEDCAYCPQSAHYNTGLQKERLMAIDDVRAAAQRAKDAGSTRFCMGAAWRGPRDADLDTVCEMVRTVKELGMETCVTLGLLKDGQAEKLQQAGLDYYNHNIDTSAEFYPNIITTRSFNDRLDTLDRVRNAGIHVCCGGILGMGETNTDRIRMLVTLANMDPPPESVPLNKLIPVPGTPLQSGVKVEPFDFVRTIALAKIMMPQSTIRLSAGREDMSPELQALCFLAGASSMFYGEKLLTTDNPTPAEDDALFAALGLKKAA